MPQGLSMFEELFLALSDCLDSSLAIEERGKEELRKAACCQIEVTDAKPLPPAYQEIFLQEDARPVCKLIAEAGFDWSPPKTSDDPAYVRDSVAKAHVELVGPDGLVKSDKVRLGLYGMLPGYEYGLRTHLAEEVFVMLAGEADWKSGDGSFTPLRAGDRSYHPSMLPHANRTRDQAFMSVYIWYGDVSTDSYVYQGLK